MSIRVELCARMALKFHQESGYEYEVFDGETFLCDGFAAGSSKVAKQSALDHARRVIRLRERRAAAHITGETP